MYVPIILFFTSLISIATIIGRKLLVLENIGIVQQENISFELPYLDEVKEVTTHNVKKYGYATLVITLRLYFRSANILKQKFEEMRNKIKRMRKHNNIESEKKEISKFLKIIGEYKHKIRDIKHRISKEESL